MVVCIIGVIFALFVGKDWCARSVGDKTTINLSPGMKLVNASWKANELWYLTRSARSNETFETLEYTQHSSNRFAGDKVVFVEHENAVEGP